ncbi:MAG: hypothetical protein IJQ68_02835 [Methanobrevibacter sp.]|uniref:hypothetical protein n=1 Tax=Methanobrevibacter sp. TaxID=66852 RepID=UPI0025F4482C|nr:hypothetical protein [Methanobrevibacter sp.]MBR0270910.1 hypothetical protein [Methanobrevibacter sp.]
MKKIYVLSIAIVILLFTAGIYAISNDVVFSSTQDVQDNNGSEKTTVTDLEKNTTTDGSSSSDSLSISKDLSSSITPYKIINGVAAIYRDSSIPFTDSDVGIVYVDDNGDLYMYGGDRDTTYWGKPGEPDVFNPSLNNFSENDLPSPPKIIGMKKYYSMDRLSSEQIELYNSGAYDSYSDESGNIYVAVDNMEDK